MEVEQINKKVIIGIGIVAAVVVLLVVLAIVFGDNGSKELELTYETNAGVPYKWEYTIEDESIVKFVKTKEISANENKELVGAQLYINYIFKGLKEGKTTITFKYVNFTDGSVDKEETVTVKVDKNKNISLVAMP